MHVVDISRIINSNKQLEKGLFSDNINVSKKLVIDTNLEKVMEEFEGKSINELKEMLVIACKNNDLNQVKNLATKSDLKDNLDQRLILNGFSVIDHNKGNIGLMTYMINLAKKIIKGEEEESFSKEDVLKMLPAKYRNLVYEEATQGNFEKLEFLLSNDFEHLRQDPDFASQLLVKAVDSGNVNVVKLVCSSPATKEKINFQYNHGLAFLNACEYGNAEIVKYLAASPDIKGRIDIHTSSDNGFRMACKNGHLEVVQTLLSIPDFGNSWSLSNCLSSATASNKTEVVKFLFGSSEYKQHITESDYQSAFNDACYNGNTALAKYFLTSPELEYHATVNGDTGAPNDYSYSNAIIAAIKGDQTETLRFLIFEENADKTKIIDTYLAKNPHENVEKMFTIREAHEKLLEKLPENHSMSKKNKI